MGILGKWTKRKEKEERLKTGEADLASEEKKEESGVRALIKKQKEEKKGSAETKEAVPASQRKGEGRRVLIRPHVSEKSVMHEGKGVYTFVVEKKATKIDIRRAVKDRYGVSPSDVRVMNFEGKQMRFGRAAGRRGAWKKAIVTVPKGTSLSLHEGV